MATGNETIPGLGERKRALTCAGGGILDMAIAMMETTTMLPSPRGYLLGDVDGLGVAKRGDAANFGIFKQNWKMIREAWPPFQSLGAADWMRGCALNGSLSLDVHILHASMRFYGPRWFHGHRQGESGLVAPDACSPMMADILNYQRAVYWIANQLEPDHLTDDLRFWDNTVPAI
ncbi:hypothetical protein [Dyella sp.]|uniref:hypothetical protein n=1 Tax=Dyella sp. TaxID=1869338 RepID=UPI002ED0CA94